MTQPVLRRRRRTRIVATLGPSSDTPEVIGRLFHTGADVFRLNFSHGTEDDHRRRLAAVRALEAEAGRPATVLADLQGPKLRLGRFTEGRIALEPGQRLRLDLDPAPGDTRRAPLPHPEIIEAVAVGAEILLDDGNVRLKVLDKGPDWLETQVEAGTALSDRKGVNLPGAVLGLSALTEKDRRDLAAALEMGVDWIALSFVQRPEDVAEARRLIGGRVPVLVKLEKPAAIDCLDQLIEVADGFMVARGDLGVELPPERVPPLQKAIVRAARAAGKPVIVATQMLESMVEAPRPTRAEASDVATGVYDGADAVMLSAETAAGRFPVEAVAMMDRIIAAAEADPLYPRLVDVFAPSPEASADDAVTAAAVAAAHTLNAAAIVTFTVSGATTLRAVRARPRLPVLCLTPRPETARRVMLSAGVHARVVAEVSDVTGMTETACQVARAMGYARAGQRIVITAGIPFGTPGSTNVMRIAWV